MKIGKQLVTILMLLPLLVIAQETESQYIQWTGDDEIANALVGAGIDCAMNIEFEKAYTFFDAAVAKDPTLFAPHVMLRNFSKGEKRAYHKEQAQKLVEGKNEVSKLYVSLMNIKWKDNEENARMQRDEIWKKMHELAFDGKFVHFRYIQTIKDENARIAEYEKLAAELEEADRNSGHVHNMLGYTHYAMGNKDKAKAHFEKYVELRPKGYNAYDSMAEFYMNEGDNENAMKYYNKALMHYPGANNAKDKLEELKKKKEVSEAQE
ncbi:MAG: tetratricopeptide repeat protein [Flavobacteriaceae bacterium]|nr:tetratricopeptide repeat protein [Flavobacteriaceae bacterium]